MTIKYCQMCNRDVQASRKIGAGSVIAVLFTGFLWLLVIPFYSKRCPLCGNSHLLNSKPRQIESKNNTINQKNKVSSIADEINKLHELKEKGVITESEFAAQKQKILS